MIVSHILSGKGSNVLTSGPQATIADVASTLADNKIGALVVVEDDGSVCGIVSERDVVRQIAARGPDALNLPCSVCMTRKVVSCSEEETIDSVMGKMSEGRFRHLPVVRDGRLAGIISIGDVVKNKIEQAERDAEELKRYIAG